MEGYRVFQRQRALEELKELGVPLQLFEEFSLEKLKEELREKKLRLKEEAEKK